MELLIRKNVLRRRKETMVFYTKCNAIQSKQR